MIYQQRAEMFQTKPVSCGQKGLNINELESSNAKIIEDDYDIEMKYLSNSIPALKSLDKSDHVVYLGSFSKIFIPSIRISYMMLPKWLLNLYIEKFSLYENTTSKLHQKTLARFVKESYWQKHVQKMRRYYIKKYKYIILAVNTYLDDKVGFISINSGLSLLLEINTLESEMELAARTREAWRIGELKRNSQLEKMNIQDIE